MTLRSGLVQVPVDGGDLMVEVSTGRTHPVLAIHGISSNRCLWNWLKAEAPELTLVAPDLRGRADSVHVVGPSCVQQHASDLVRVLDALEVDQPYVLGMSMGGFVAVDLAVRHPARVRGLVLVDGGFPMAAPAGVTAESLPLVFADRMARLGRTWTLDEYAEFFTSATAPLLDPHDPVLRQYLQHDLLDGHVRLSGEVLTQDASSIFFGENRWSELQIPVRFLHAQWSVGKDSPPAYPDEAVARYGHKTVRSVRMAAADHAATIMSVEGARATAALLREAMA